MPREPGLPPEKPAHVVGEMFSGSNVELPAQPRQPSAVQGGFTPTNISLPTQPQNTLTDSTHDNGFTPSSITQPAVQPKPSKGKK